MHLWQYIVPDAVLLRITTSGKNDLISRLCKALVQGMLARGDHAAGIQSACQAVLEREARQTTAVGHGLAFPHARIPGLQRMAIGLAIPATPLDFDAPDGQPVRIVCMMLTPEENPTLSIKVMAQLVRLLSDENNRRRFLEARDFSDLRAVIESAGLRIDLPVTAREIMRPAVVTFNPRTPLRVVAHQMSVHHVEAVAVTDEDGTLRGQITCDHLFQFGMPDFFSQLKSVSFIREFDPFEKYFKAEGGAVAADLMDQNLSAMSPDATILEIVFALTVRKYPKIYVTEDARLRGVIDKSAVLDRIINF